LGAEGYRIYCSLAVDIREPYDDAVGRLRAHFAQSSSQIFERTQFSRCRQRADESIMQYVAALRDMASRCEFPADQLNNRIRDQFVAWIHSGVIRERLFQEPGTRTLDEMIQLAQTMERARSEASATSPSAASEQPVHAVERLSNRKYNNNFRLSKPAQSPGRCGNCDTEGHMASSLDCPARGKECLSCGKLGHTRAVVARKTGQKNLVLCQPHHTCRDAVSEVSLVTEVVSEVDQPRVKYCSRSPITKRHSRSVLCTFVR
jgi:hypothetical protein